MTFLLLLLFLFLVKSILKCLCYSKAKNKTLIFFFSGNPLPPLRSIFTGICIPLAQARVGSSGVSGDLESQRLNT